MSPSMQQSLDPLSIFAKTSDIKFSKESILLLGTWPVDYSNNYVLAFLFVISTNKLSISEFLFPSMLPLTLKSKLSLI